MRDLCEVLRAMSYVSVGIVWDALRLAQRHPAPALVVLAVVLQGCATLSCSSPLAEAAERAAALDFETRGSSVLMRCEGETFIYSLKAVP